MSPEDQATKGFTQMILDRIGHPFIGSFIFTFVVTNYDILIDLFVNIRDPLSVLIFNSFLYGEWKVRIVLPVTMMFAFPLLIQHLGDVIYNFSKEFFNQKIANIKEGQKNKIHKLRIPALLESIETHRKVNEFISEKSSALLSYLLKNHGILKESSRYILIENKNGLNENEFVSYYKEFDLVIPFNNKHPILGRVLKKFPFDFYVVEFLGQVQINSILSDVGYSESSLQTYYQLQRDGSITKSVNSNYAENELGYKLHSTKDTIISSVHPLESFINNEFETYLKNRFIEAK
ncbi:hypothetical protein [Leptospira vanthielii]|uniref:Uncharacterized protein n=1 Tax=Leptospira vanthielii serovar Holland str. Waz Holland = ATCC 700522 TaxID=1218591 RepID=N1W8U7_9LEPT|nr:hypothetical protein [Leptospira vanthielii]EMY69875.1 hypothetical protein LEP1GSC199_2380 [Leptospira vanthielii serovar Holland str. Waz Holland = ATCC 700522]